MDPRTNQVCSVLARLARQVDSPRAIAVRLLAEGGEWPQLQKLEAVDPGNYSDAEAYMADAMVTDFARKSPPLEGNLRDTAVKTFWQCERTNSESNARLARYVGNQGPFSLSEVRVSGFIDLWRKKVKCVLGKLPDGLDLRFSPGATTSNKGSKITIPDKIETRPVVYESMRCLEPFIYASAWGRIHGSVRLSSDRGNVFFSVPKDSKKDRGCCKEASAAVVLQLGVGTLIRKRLLRFGIDLDQGQDLHRELARKGSADGSVATLDLSNASDTICRTLVRLLLPDEWYQLLDSLRAPFTNVDGKFVYLEKFSSMGNGFTFELETLIFWTLAETLREQTSTHGQTWCYGDDLIVPAEPGYVDALMAALRYFGFTPNSAKTFVAGPFRESCGGDFFDGVAVRPHYLKKYPDEPQDWIALHNGLVRIGRPHLTGEARRFCMDQLPTAIRKLRGPASLGDTVLHRDETEWVVKRPSDGWDGVWVRALVPLPRRLPLHHWTPDVVHASALYGVPSDGVTPRGHVRGFKISWLWYPAGARSGTKVPEWASKLTAGS